MQVDQSQRTIRPYSSGSDVRTMADAVDEMRKVVKLLKLPPLESQAITIAAGLIELPSGDLTTTVALTIPDNIYQGIFAFLIPNCLSFRARNSLGFRHQYSAVALNGATVEADSANVRLPDGTWVHALNFVHVRSMPVLNERRREILFEVIRALDRQSNKNSPRKNDDDLGIFDRCMRRVIYDFGTSTLQVGYAAVPDFAAIQREILPSLKRLENLISAEMPDVSREVLTVALAAAGMRRPRSGSKSTKSSTGRTTIQP